MTTDEAATLAGFLKGAFPSLTDEQIDVYQSGLVFEDAQLASKAILDGIREWKFPPRYAEIVERIRSQRRAVTPPRPVEEAVVDLTIPEWVRRWVYARFVIKPPDMRPFREQHRPVEQRGDEPALGWMPGNEYALQSKAITDAMVRAKVAEVTGAAGMSSPALKDLLGEA